jgi:hypothetical protein
MARDAGPTGRLSRIPEATDDAFDQWMTRIAELDDVAVDALLRGDTPDGCGDLAPVAELTAAVRRRVTAESPAMSSALRAQIRQQPHVAPRFVGAPRRRLQLAAAAAFALLFVGVAATRNALPAAAQRVVANVAHVVGLDVPRPEDDDAPDDSTTDPGSTKGAADEDEGTGSDGPAVPGAPDGRAGASDGDDTGSPQGPPDQTPGGATPADPGTPGDHEPATPAEPPAHSNGGSDGGNNSTRATDSNAGATGNGGVGTGGANGNATGRSTAPGQTTSVTASDEG